MLEQLRLLSRYNQWMNDKVYNRAAQLPADELARDRGAFFGSLLGTLNHIMVADIIWLQGFSGHPALNRIRAMTKPQALAPLPSHRLQRVKRGTPKFGRYDHQLVRTTRCTRPNHKLAYSNMKGEAPVKNFGSLMLHFFNHQTHHKGQATTLLSQQGLDVGVTDLVTLITPECLATVY
jgi:uncharacterized damage-inducible protein DinB